MGKRFLNCGILLFPASAAPMVAQKPAETSQVTAQSAAEPISLDHLCLTGTTILCAI